MYGCSMFINCGRDGGFYNTIHVIFLGEGGMSCLMN